MPLDDVSETFTWSYALATLETANRAPASSTPRGDSEF